MNLAGVLGAVVRRISRRDLLEAGLVAAAFLLYFAVRGSVVDRPAEALANSLDVIAVQRRLGFFWEADMQEWILDNLFLVQAANIVYFWLHFPLIIVFGIYLYIRDRHRYTFLRDAFLVSGAISLIVYVLYPVAPPRLLPQLAQELGVSLPADVTGLVDTMNVYLNYAYQSQETGAFVNPYAAMPSLHFGWDFLLGLGIIWVFRRPWAVVLGVALPLMQIVAVAVTANHYFLDAFAGMVVSIMGLPMAIAVQRWVYPRLGRFVEQRFGHLLGAEPPRVKVGD
ncbi:MAG: phosphatase PAP2 family protein [Dehalococcoidia bacterium]